MSQEEKKTENQLLEEKLFQKKESSWLSYQESDQKEIFTFADEYKDFMATSKTERLCVHNIISELAEKGFKNIDSIKKAEKYAKVYKNVKDKTVIAFVVGENPEQIHLIGSHIDSPRLDLKPSPLYEDSELALLQSHFYGGIKKHHWVNVPLSLHGVVFTNDGKKISLHIGDQDNEAKFIIPDLLPHLAKEQMKKDAAKIIEGEELNIIVGHIPINDKDIKEKIKFNILKKLYDDYGLIEEDFNCAELEFVPALRPIDIGLDRSLIGAYGQDDRICVYTSLRAIADIEKPKHTAVSLFVDKEEIGSTGDTGAESFMLVNFARQYQQLIDSARDPWEILQQARSISADVTAAMDPTFADVCDKQNSSYLGKGISIEKYGGGGGKYETNDSHAEYMQYIRQLARNNNIPWQITEMGKIGVGGGGTIAMFLSRYGMDCVDAGLCMLGMHSTCEVTSKADLFSAYRFYKVFYND